MTKKAPPSTPVDSAEAAPTPDELMDSMLDQLVGELTQVQSALYEISEKRRELCTRIATMRTVKNATANVNKESTCPLE